VISISTTVCCTFTILFQFPVHWYNSILICISGVVPELQKGDVLGHEFCGVVESVGPAAKKVKVGDRVVASFQIACGECFYCQRKLSSVCDRTNNNKIANVLYGGRTAGKLMVSSSLGKGWVEGIWVLITVA